MDWAHCGVGAPKCTQLLALGLVTWHVRHAAGRVEPHKPSPPTLPSTSTPHPPPPHTHTQMLNYGMASAAGLREGGAAAGWRARLGGMPRRHPREEPVADAGQGLLRATKRGARGHVSPGGGRDDAEPDQAPGGLAGGVRTRIGNLWPHQPGKRRLLRQGEGVLGRVGAVRPKPVLRKSPERSGFAPDREWNRPAPPGARAGAWLV